MTSTQLVLDPSYKKSIAPEVVAKPWFAIRVKSQYEKITAVSLHNKGYEEFAPMYRSRRYWSDRVKELDLPLFPGYIFCRFDPLHRLPILMSPGIVSIVGVGKNPEPVDDGEIARIQAIVSSGALACPWPFLRAGQKVAVTRGPLCGVEGFLVNSKNQHRLVVSIQLLQRSVAAEIDRDWVQPIS
ncbi:MAG TPA: UpxY family transcription antiterminator [Bryobacteraceae bacterium]|jgi:transcription antitermination factor NusG|nr:UpxY family transcription antiterminator [Bryobacteraceae bacterium]